MKIREALTFDDVQIVPKFSNILSRKNVFTHTNVAGYHHTIPIVAAPMDTVCGVRMAIELARIGALGCLHRFCTIEEQAKMAREVLHAHVDNPVKVCAAVGVTGDYKERASELFKAGTTYIVLDVAHGHHQNVADAIKAVKELPEYNETHVVVAGSIATAEAAKFLIDAGADCLRVGVGGGSACETRIRTGIGVPQLQAILDVVEVAGDVPVIADGGIRYPGDVAKALAAGASMVMIGGLLAGTDEAPGEIFIAGQWPNNKTMKMFRGSASATAKLAVHGNTEHVEGASKLVESRGPAERIINDLMEGVKSSMSYVGSNNLVSFQTNAEFVRITSSGLIEAHPHMLR